MKERKRVEVNEKHLTQVIAGESDLSDVQAVQSAEDENTLETEIDESVHEEVVVPVKTGKRKIARQANFEGSFLKEAKIKDRRQMYISGEFYDRIAACLRIISEGKVSMVGYIHNVPAHHMMEFKETINEMYRTKINKSNPL